MESQITSSSANLATYICSGLASLILVARLSTCRIGPRPFDASFFITLLCLHLILARVILSYFVLRYGTTSDYLTTNVRPEDLTEAQLHTLKTGSILSLLLRLLLTTILWALSLLLLLVYSRFISHLPWMRLAIRLLLAFLALSYFAVLLTTFLECQPFELVYRLSPPPGSCVKAYAQVSLQCACNALVDLALMLIALPIIFIRTSPGNATHHRIRMAILVGLGLFCLTVTGLRWGYTFQARSFQPARTFWASLNVLVATIVANAPVLYGAARLVALGRRKLTPRWIGSGGTAGRHGTAGRTTMPAATSGVHCADRIGDDEEKIGIVKETTFTVVADEEETERGRDEDTVDANLRDAQGGLHEVGASATAHVEHAVDDDTHGIEHLPPTKPA